VAPSDVSPVQLTSLATGDSARLHETTLDADTRARLRSLGLTDDSILRVCKSGDPCFIQVRDTRIGVSSAVAGQILVLVTRDNFRMDGVRVDAADARHLTVT
jgi:Fe2+ transport system protein FeoA